MSYLSERVPFTAEEEAFYENLRKRNIDRDVARIIGLEVLENDIDNNVYADRAQYESLMATIGKTTVLNPPMFHPSYSLDTAIAAAKSLGLVSVITSRDNGFRAVLISDDGSGRASTHDSPALAVCFAILDFAGEL